MGLDYSTESDGARRRLISGMKIQYPVVPVVLADVQVRVELRENCAAADGTPTYLSLHVRLSPLCAAFCVVRLPHEAPPEEAVALGSEERERTVDMGSDWL